MGQFTLFHLYLIFFLLGLGYATIAVLMGQLLGGHEAAHDVGGHEAGGHEIGGHDVDHDFGHDVGGHEAGADADHDFGDHDAGHDHAVADVDMGEAMPTLSPWSPVTIATFATAFGGTGLILDKIGMPALVSVPIAGGSGFVIAFGVFYLFYRVFSITQSTSSVSVRYAVGKHADVITPIPVGGVGEIAYVLGGRRFNVAARSEGNTAIPTGSNVIVSRIKGGSHYVRTCDRIAPK
jgi:membrane protein implicated in regulation of membrane protease activity